MWLFIIFFRLQKNEYNTRVSYDKQRSVHGRLRINFLAPVLKSYMRIHRRTIAMVGI